MQEKIRKLRAIANSTDGGSENERQIARNILKRYEEQWYDINISNKIDRFFSIKSEDEKSFFLQIVASIYGNDFSREDFPKMYSSILMSTGGRKTISIRMELDEIEYLELKEKHDFYYANYKKQLKDTQELFRSGYIQKNHLYANPEKTNPNKGKKDETDIGKLAAMYQIVDQVSNYKRLT